MAFSFPIGKARQRVTIERATEVTDGYGQIAYQWATLADVWAKVETASGRERVIAEQLRGVATHLITIRGRLAVTPKDRAVFNGRVLNFLEVVDPDNQDWTRRITAVEVVA